MYTVVIKIREAEDAWSKRSHTFETMSEVVRQVTAVHSFADQMQMQCGRDYEVILTRK